MLIWPEDPLDGVLFLAWFIAWFYTLGTGEPGMTTQRGTREVYKMIRKRIPLAPPPATFGLVWSILYTLLWISCWLLSRDVDFSLQYTTNYRWFWGLALINLVSNKIWTMLFTTNLDFLTAFFDLLVVYGSAIGLLCVSWSISYFAMVTFSAYVAWLSFAAYLNLQAIPQQGMVNKIASQRGRLENTLTANALSKAGVSV